MVRGAKKGVVSPESHNRQWVLRGGCDTLHMARTIRLQSHSRVSLEGDQVLAYIPNCTTPHSTLTQLPTFTYIFDVIYALHRREYTAYTTHTIHSQPFAAYVRLNSSYRVL